MFFSKSGEYQPCGIFSSGHFLLLFVTLMIIYIALKRTKDSDQKMVTKIIKNLTIFVWILEIIKIIYNLKIGNGHNLNTFIPLYYCSLLLYCGLFSSFCRGKLKRCGDVFLATGGIVGSLAFLIFPSTSLPAFPLFHFISFHSFIYHGVMLYIGLLINITNYIIIDKNDIIYFASLVGVMCLLALFVNLKSGSNLMFISKDFPGTPVSTIYHLTGKYFTLIMTLSQMTLPFYLIYGIKKINYKHNFNLVLAHN